MSRFSQHPFFDFHHHNTHLEGIYNLSLFEEIPHDTLFSVGIHPKDIVDDMGKAMEWLKKTSMQDQCFAIGECGLDALVEVSQSTQESIFLEQIHWANEIKKPIIIHCVRLFSDLLKFKKKSEVPMVVHGFNKKWSVAETLLDKGFYLSFGKAVLHNVSLQAVVAKTPLEKLFIESDDSEIELSELYQKITIIKNIALPRLQQQIYENLERIENAK